jgi:hypothetical protein
LRGVAAGEEAVESRLVMPKLYVIFLRDDLSVGLFPCRNAAGVVAVGMRKDLDIGENWRLNPAVLAAFFAFDNVVSDFNVAGGFV